MDRKIIDFLVDNEILPKDICQDFTECDIGYYKSILNCIKDFDFVYEKMFDKLVLVDFIGEAKEFSLLREKYFPNKDLLDKIFKTEVYLINVEKMYIKLSKLKNRNFIYTLYKKYVEKKLGKFIKDKKILNDYDAFELLSIVVKDKKYVSMMKEHLVLMNELFGEEFNFANINDWKKFIDNLKTLSGLLNYQKPIHLTDDKFQKIKNSITWLSI